MSANQTVACLYLHGFLSSPASAKAQQTLEYFQRELPGCLIKAPVLPFSPFEAIQLARQTLDELAQQCPQVFVIGSSLGGFYATRLAQDLGVPAVLVNPAVRPHELFRHYLGPVTHYHTGEVHQLEERHLQMLADIAVESIAQPNKLLVLLQTGDATLDYRHAEQLYERCQLVIEAGGDHAFQGYDQHLPAIVAFARQHYYPQ
ncbi:YqiA/YcfP family alpha/beta fold hydrolase [Oceanobacter mangrovi]|uniref:YqiA/YcfP family alpha/beta fold hydrolase n=1 Tax=Oceanobacter mangrovi TaxID=2862510 RepID=UPI001C8E7E62|nr:YqiA/YcfP family alpha/beta fold hydrolase [Oceanobacter mangrovi]